MNQNYNAGQQSKTFNQSSFFYQKALTLKLATDLDLVNGLGNDEILVQNVDQKVFAQQNAQFRNTEYTTTNIDFLDGLGDATKTKNQSL